MLSNEIYTKESVSDINDYPSKDIESRGLRKEILEKFGVKVAVSQEDGKTPEAIYFPSYNQKGVVVGYTKQDLTKDKEETGHWSTIGSVKIGNKLFGQNVSEKANRKRTNIVITEGQHDCLSVYQSLVDSVRGTKYEGIEPMVVSIPLGTKNAVESILHNEEYIKSHDAITLFFDDDKTTPAEAKKGIVKGHEAVDAVAGAMLGSGVKIFTVTASDGCKDASDMLQAGKNKELAKLVSFGKREYTPEKIIRVSDVSFEDIIAPPPQGVMVPQFPKLMDKLSGLHKRALTLVGAPSGVGKSTAVSIIASEIEKSGERLGMIYLEEQTKETVQRLIAEKLKVNYLKFKRNPLKFASREKLEEVYREITDKNDVLLLNHFGSMPIDELMNKVKYLHLVEGCDYIILDHISMVISGEAVGDERKELDIVMTQLAAFCAAHDVGILVVCHLNRQGTADQFRVKKGEEDKPYWVRVTKESFRGSAALEQLSFVILGLEPEILPTRERGNVRWVILKNRPTGYLGEADIWRLNEQTWEVETFEPEDF